jgi:mono/diheme cytochrome c family protein
VKTTEPKRFSASDRTMIGFGVIALIVLMGLALKGEHKASATHAGSGAAPASDPSAIAVAAAIKAQMTQGEELYHACVMCHGPAGEGIDGQYPPLIKAPLVIGPPSRLARVLINGLEGPTVVNGKTYDMPMPAAPLNDDTEVAAVMTFIRRSFGNRASAVTPEFVAKVREEIGTRDTSWTAEELEKVP